MNKMLTPEDIRALPPSERSRLIEELWDSLDADGADLVPMPEWHKAILDDRLTRSRTERQAVILGPTSVVGSRAKSDLNDYRSI